MVKLLNRAKETTSTVGTGNLVLTGAVHSFQTFANAGAATGDYIRYVIEDAGGAWEIGLGTFDSATSTLTRNSQESSNSGNALSLSGNAAVFSSPVADDLKPQTYTSTLFTATQGQTTFTVNYDPDHVQVFMNGVLLITDSNTDATATSGTNIILSSGANAGDLIKVIAWSSLDILDQGLSSTDSPTFAGLTVDGGTIKLNGNHPVGSINVALGEDALSNNTSGFGNSALGSQALRNNTTGNSNSALGSYALLNNTTGNANSALGSQALLNNTTGILNSVFGYYSGIQITTGSRNSILGTYNGNQNSLDIRTSDYNIVLSDGNGNPRLHTDGSGVTTLRRNASSGNALVFNYGDSTSVGSVSITSTATTYNTTSDRRLKTNIQSIADSTEKLMAMNPVMHRWKSEPEENAVHGFIAQEMQEIVPEAVSGDPDGEVMMSMDYGRITPVLVAALQDAHKKIEALEKRLLELETR